MDPAARAVGSVVLVAEPVLRVAEGFTFPVGNIGGNRGSAGRTLPRPIARRAGELAAAASRQGSRKTRDEQRKPITAVNPAANGPPSLTFRAPWACT